MICSKCGKEIKGTVWNTRKTFVKPNYDIEYVYYMMDEKCLKEAEKEGMVDSYD